MIDLKLKNIIENEAEEIAGDEFYEEWNNVYHAYLHGALKWFELGKIIGSKSMTADELITELSKNIKP